MVEKRELRMGQHVSVRLCGGEVVGAVVDGMCNDWVGVRLDRGGYVISDWEDIEVEVGAEEVVRTEQGEVLARIPNYLNEVADYARRQVEELLVVIKKYDDYSDEQIEELRTHLMAMFLEGTGWQKEKMMEEAVECELVCLKDRLLAVLPTKEFRWTVGDKVRIIIVKED